MCLLTRQWLTYTNHTNYKQIELLYLGRHWVSNTSSIDWQKAATLNSQTKRRKTNRTNSNVLGGICLQMQEFFPDFFAVNTLSCGFCYQTWYLKHFQFVWQMIAYGGTRLLVSSYQLTSPLSQLIALALTLITMDVTKTPSNAVTV